MEKSAGEEGGGGGEGGSSLVDLHGCVSPNGSMILGFLMGNRIIFI